MKRLGAWSVGLTVLAMLTSVVCAGPLELTPASAQERAAYGATHVLDIRYDLPSVDTVTTSNALWATTNALPAGSAVRLVLMRLNTAWDAANTESLQIYSGTAATSNLFLSATQIAEDGTEIFHAYPDLYLEQGNLLGGTNVVTNVSNRAQFFYCTTATNIITKIQPNSLSALDAWTKGRVKLYWAIYTPGQD